MSTPASSYNDELFRQQIPAFATDSMESQFPSSVMEIYYGTAQDFIAISSCPCAMLRGASLVLALNLMTAHIATLMSADVDNVESGDQAGLTNGIETNASVGSVSVGVMAPPVDNMWDYWLAQTAYGQMLQALLKVKSVGGIYVGGRPETLAFRKAFGRFG